MNTKHLRGVEVKDADKGEVTAVFSTFNVIDSDGDVTLPGAFEDGTPVRVSAYGHASWGAALPVGKGVIRTTKTEALFDGRFFLNTQHGRDTFEVVKEMGELQEWSYSVEPVKHSFGEFEGQRVTFLEKLKGPHEVSPVLAGAGVNTRTLAVKSAGMTLQDEIAAASDVVAAVLESAERVVALRAEKGKTLSQVNRDSLDGLREHLKALDALLQEVPPEADPGNEAELAREYLRFVAQSLA